MPFLGLRTVLYHCDDLVAGKEWYEKALQVKPYFDEPFYVGFNVGGFELGLKQTSEKILYQQGSSSVSCWGVVDIQEEHARLLLLGATELEEIRCVGEDLYVSVVQDPFGNAFGLIQNPHFPNTL